MATLLVLAAGMGSRYGGLKQMESVGPSGEAVLDYSVHDALRAGFRRVVFVIRRDFAEEFRRVVLARYEKSVDVELVFQDPGDLPFSPDRPFVRTKPWGTGHAIWCARNAVNESFLAVNADDFYGRSAFFLMSRYLDEIRPGECSGMGMVAYPLGKTLSDHGSVSRGICRVTADGLLERVEEHTDIVRGEGGIMGIDAGGRVCCLDGNEAVSMNFWGFTKEIFPHLEKLFVEFLQSEGVGNPKAEFYIPSAVSSIIALGAARVSVFLSNERWFGVTYREDRESVMTAVGKMVEQGMYRTPLWSQTT